MVNEVGSNLIKFADDTKLWRIIINQEDRDVLQKDMDKMVIYSKKWMLNFHPKKCKVLQLGSRNQNYEYKQD